MTSFQFQTDGGLFHESNRIGRPIKFRGKGPYNPYKTWVVGGYFHVDDCKNDPFRSYPLNENHFIVNYYPGDWNLGNWNNNEVYPNTVQQYIGLSDANDVDIYEGDIVRIYYGISYDKDGTITLSDEYRDVLVSFENGVFKFGDDPISDFEPQETYRFVVIGNVFDTIEHPIAKDYHITRLCRNFDGNANISEDASIAFAHLAMQITSLPLLDIVTNYSVKHNEIRVVFQVNCKKFVISESLSVERGENKHYSATQFDYTGEINKWESDTLADVINNIMENI
jgi:uncharacterized phage protein (TIGR01671 family)